MLKARLITLYTSERGANLVEYTLLISFIVLVAILAVTFVGQETASNIESVKAGF